MGIEMWTIIKFDKKNLSLLKKDFKEKLGSNFKNQVNLEYFSIKDFLSYTFVPW